MDPPRTSLFRTNPFDACRAFPGAPFTTTCIDQSIRTLSSTQLVLGDFARIHSFRGIAIRLISHRYSDGNKPRPNPHVHLGSIHLRRSLIPSNRIIVHLGGLTVKGEEHRRHAGSRDAETQNVSPASRESVDQGGLCGIFRLSTSRRRKWWHVYTCSGGNGF